MVLDSRSIPAHPRFAPSAPSIQKRGGSYGCILQKLSTWPPTTAPFSMRDYPYPSAFFQSVELRSLLNMSFASTNYIFQPWLLGFRRLLSIDIVRRESLLAPADQIRLELHDSRRQQQPHFSSHLTNSPRTFFLRSRHTRYQYNIRKSIYR
jgi:hypothetical protein